MMEEVEKQNKVYVAKTRANGVFVSWVVKPDKIGPCSMDHIRDNFRYLDVKVLRASNISAVMKFRGDILSHVFVTIAEEDEAAEEIGKTITWHLAALDALAKDADCPPQDYSGPYDGEEFNFQQGFAFGGVVSEDDNLSPLSCFLLDEDILLIINRLYGDHNTKEAVMSEESIMDGFFGSVQKGRDLVSGYSDFWWGA